MVCYSVSCSYHTCIVPLLYYYYYYYYYTRLSLGMIVFTCIGE